MWLSHHTSRESLLCVILRWSFSAPLASLPLYLSAVIHAGRPCLLSASFKSPLLVFTSHSPLALLVDASQPSSSTQPPEKPLAAAPLQLHSPACRLNALLIGPANQIKEHTSKQSSVSPWILLRVGLHQSTSLGLSCQSRWYPIHPLNQYYLLEMLRF